MHIVHKKLKTTHESNRQSLPTSKDVTITVDPKNLNKALQREYFRMKTIEEITTMTTGSKFFSTIDANMGYFQIELDEASQNYTIFNTPFGRYKYRRLPMGITSAPEIYQRAMNDMFGDIEGVEIIMDDILIHGPTIE